MMAAMGMAKSMPWTATDVMFTFAMWVVMMVAMMAGSAAPVLFLYAATRAGRQPQGGAPGVLMFALGYAAVWVGFSGCAALVQWILHRAAWLTPAMAASSPYLAGPILIAAGVYQLSSWKGACLKQCRSPLGFLMTNWRDGALGAGQMGARHGMYCLGCCWALMCVLFVVGVMNLVWVAALTGLVLLEKVGASVTGAAMMVGGILLIAARV